MTAPETVEMLILAPYEVIPGDATLKPSPWIAFRAEAERLKAVAETLTVTRVDDRAAPDVEKIRAFAETVRRLQCPKLKNEDAAGEIIEMTARLANRIETRADELEGEA